MRPAVIAVAIATVAFCLAACSSSEEAGWTYAPPPTEVAASGAPSGAPGSPAPSAEVSPAPSEAPSASAPPSAPASAAPSGSAPASAPASAAGGEVVTVTAQNITFEQADLEVAAGKPFTLEFVNNDASVPHNVEIRDRAGKPVFKTDTFPGVETRSFDAPALAAGAYQFACTIHPNMIIDVNAT